LPAGIPTPTEPLVAVRSLAESAARQRGWSFVGSGLRLFQGITTDCLQGETERVDDSSISAFALGRTYELLLAPDDRRITGAHLTPEAIARQLVALMPAPMPTDRVLDPSVGGGAFLLAAADQLVEVGANPVDVLGQLHGIDIDAGAVAIAEASLAVWALDHGVQPVALPTLDQGDGLLRSLPNVERVVGNPPFLSQLRSASSHTAERRAALRERWGESVTAYTDDAWLFLAAGIDALADNGSLAMVQPISVLAARHGAQVRSRVAAVAAMRALWVARDKVFDASVQVCGIVFQRSDNAESQPVARYVGAGFESCESLASQPHHGKWGVAASATLGVPPTMLGSAHDEERATVGDWAVATAGFRDQFYGLVPFVSEAAAPDVAEATVAGCSPLVTVGMIDVLELHWGARAHRFAGQKYWRPVIDVDQLRKDDPKLGEWVDARRRPKILMATQTRVVELWVDVAGTAVPTTPVLSIEPHDADDDRLWLVAAALSAPVLSAYFAAKNFGTAMSLNAMKVAARDVLAAPLPTDTQLWKETAYELRHGNVVDIELFGQQMNAAYGVESKRLLDWWLDRVPNRSDV